jgi:predicted kinase
MPTLYMLIGVPGSGKSTWIKSQNFDPSTTVVASTDNEIERVAAAAGKTYSDVFTDTIKGATAIVTQNVVDAVRNGKDIVWDQTNTGVKARKQKLDMIPKSYKKVAVVFPTPGAVELGRRLAGRVGKNIPDHVMRTMISGLQPPTAAEGFDKIVTA